MTLLKPSGGWVVVIVVLSVAELNAGLTRTDKAAPNTTAAALDKLIIVILPMVRTGPWFSI
jgi:hypothetical protein